MKNKSLFRPLLSSFALAAAPVALFGQTEYNADTTINNGTAFIDFSANVNSGATVTAERAGAVNTFRLRDSALVWNVNSGGVLDVTASTSLSLEQGSLNVNGGALQTAGNFDASDIFGPSFTLSAGSASISGETRVNRRTSFEVSGGTYSTNGFTVANAGLASSTNYNIAFSGGTSSLGALGLYWATDAGRAGQMTIGGSAHVSATSLLFAAHGTPTNELGQDNTFINFTSDWTGGLTITGASTVSDYWNLFDTNSSTAGTAFVRYDDANIGDLAEFSSIFNVNGGALSIIPEPATVALFSALAMIGLVAYRRRKAA